MKKWQKVRRANARKGDELQEVFHVRNPQLPGSGESLYCYRDSKLCEGDAKIRNATLIHWDPCFGSTTCGARRKLRVNICMYVLKWKETIAWICIVCTNFFFSCGSAWTSRLRLVSRVEGKLVAFALLSERHLRQEKYCYGCVKC